jgi:hypothetical protein
MGNQVGAVAAGAALLLMHMLAWSSGTLAPGERVLLVLATGCVAFGVLEFAVLAYASQFRAPNNVARDQDWDLVSRIGNVAIALGVLGDIAIAAGVLG